MSLSKARTTITTLALLGAATAGCARDVSADVESHEAKLEQLTKELADVHRRLADLDKFKTAQEWTNLTANLDSVAFLKPGSNGYAILRFELGVLTVSLEDVAAYANGSRVRLRWGNATGAALADVSARIEWGSVDEVGNPVNEKQRWKEVELTEVFRSGYWTNTNIVLDGVPPASLGFVRVSDVQNGQIRLLR